MADWIKMNSDLTSHPKVIALGRILMKNPAFRQWLLGSEKSNATVTAGALLFVTVGALLCVWSRAREHGKFCGEHLVLQHNTLEDLDQMAGIPGLGKALKEVGWALDRHGVTLPNFKQHNVPRTNAERQKAHRDGSKKRVTSRNETVTETVTETLRESNGALRPREEKRREEGEKSLSSSSFEKNSKKEEKNAGAREATASGEVKPAAPSPGRQLPLQTPEQIATAARLKAEGIEHARKLKEQDAAWEALTPAERKAKATQILAEEAARVAETVANNSATEARAAELAGMKRKLQDFIGTFDRAKIASELKHESDRSKITNKRKDLNGEQL